jgi:hypothetical protein
LAEDPSASDLIYLHNYFQIFIYFIYQDMIKSKNIGSGAPETLVTIGNPRDYRKSPKTPRSFILSSVTRCCMGPKRVMDLYGEDDPPINTATVYMPG